MRKLFILLFLTGVCYLARAQQYTLLIKGGYVIDPKNNLQDTLDIAVKDGKVVLVEKNIDPRQAVQVVDAGGLYVTPDLSICMSMYFMEPSPAGPIPMERRR